MLVTIYLYIYILLGWGVFKYSWYEDRPWIEKNPNSDILKKKENLDLILLL